MSKEYPIIFKDEMVRAILDGRKTQTRRIVKPQPEQPAPGSYFDAYNGGPQWNWWASDHRQHLDQIIECPFGKPGDLLWVRETWSPATPYPGNAVYRATYDYPQDFAGCWRPSIHMPRWASRITLEITNVRVERLNSITINDLDAEGMSEMLEDPDSVAGHGFARAEHYAIAGANLSFAPEILGFAEYWDSIYGDGSWEANPWVFVIEFKQVSARQEVA